ncbi:MAG: hypothetical protein CMH83_19395 [Nocardioides sp.]|nr:hypothetical protein [Nocardioides sp.]
MTIDGYPLPDSMMPTARAPRHRIRFGRLLFADGGDDQPSLVDPDPTEDIDWWLSIEGTSFETGDPEPVERTLTTMLQDGSLVVTERVDNREMPELLITVHAPDADALAAGEAYLVAEVGRRNELEWQPPDAWGAPTVFDVVTSSLGFRADDIVEVLHCRRTYALRIVAHPHARSVEEIVVAAVSAGDPAEISDTAVDTCDSTTGWSVNSGFPLDVYDGVVRTQQTNTTNSGRRFHELTRTGAFSTGGDEFLYVDWAAGAGNRYVDASAFFIDGALVAPVATIPADRDGYTRTILPAPADGTVTTLAVRAWTEPRTTKAYTSSLWIDEVGHTNGWVVPGTGRQLARSLRVAGSVRTEGSLQVSHDTDDLGNVLVYTYPDGKSAAPYLPPLRTWRTSGGTVTSDTDAVSRARETLEVDTVFEVPVANLIRGTHQLIAMLRADTAGTYNIAWSVSLPRDSYPHGLLSGTARFTVGVGAEDQWRPVRLAQVPLPPIAAAQDASRVVQITIAAADAAAEVVELDEAWIFNTEAGALTQVLGLDDIYVVGYGCNRLWIDTPTLDVPHPMIWRGWAEDRSDAQYAGAETFGGWSIHTMHPGRMVVFTVATGAPNHDVSLTYPPRWHSHARRLNTDGSLL